MFIKSSRYRRLRDDWIQSKYFLGGPTAFVVDAGGVGGASYHEALKLKSEHIEIWNFESGGKPDRLVDLDKAESFPTLPVNIDLVLCFDVLSHLYRPREALERICEAMPSGATVLLTVPTQYPIHRCPKDFYRLMPDFFERLFAELNARGIHGKSEIVALGPDLPGAISFFTPFLFKGGIAGRTLALAAEAFALLADRLLFRPLLSREAYISAFSPFSPGLGVSWKKA